MKAEYTQKETMEYFSSNSDMRLRESETLEVIIPDRYPDAREILLVTGNICARAKEQNGHPLLQAVMEIFALVESVENTLYTLSCEIPIMLHSNLPEEDDSCMFHSIRESNFDAAIINSRKISFSGEVAATITLYHRRELAYFDSLGENCVVIPWEKSVCPRSLAVTELFSVNDDLPLPTGKGDVNGIFRKSVCIDVLEKKLIHEKLIVRANAKIDLSYLTGDEKPECVTLELPFTHVFELSGMSEEELPMVSVKSERFNLIPQNKEGERMISVSLELRAEILCYQKRVIRSLEDGYSLKENIKLKRELIHFPGDIFEIDEEMETSCSLNLPADTENIEDVVTSPSIPMIYLLEDERLRIVTTIQVVVITKQGGGYRIFRIKHPVECITSLPSTAVSAAIQVGKVKPGGITGGKCDLTMTVTFRISGEKTMELQLVSDVIAEERDLTGLPSFVLTEPADGDDAYTLGKRYNARPEWILDANHLEPGTVLPLGKRLLVPVYKA